MGYGLVTLLIGDLCCVIIVYASLCFSQDRGFTVMILEVGFQDSCCNVLTGPRAYEIKFSLSVFICLSRKLLVPFTYNTPPKLMHSLCE